LVALAISTIITLQVTLSFLVGERGMTSFRQVGLFTFMLGFVRLGFIDVILSRALLRGFVTAVAVVITMCVPHPFHMLYFLIVDLSEQLIPMVGLAGLESTVNPTTTPAKVAFILDNLGSINKPTAILSFTTLLILIVARMMKQKYTEKHRWVYLIPHIFLTVVVSTLLSSAYRWDRYGIAILGDVTLSSDRSYFEIPLTKTNLEWLKKTTPTAM